MFIESSNRRISRILTAALEADEDYRFPIYFFSILLAYNLSFCILMKDDEQASICATNLILKTRITEVLAIAGIILLSIDTANTFIGQGEYGFSSPLNDQQSGIWLGIPSIILFFVAFGLGFRDKSRLTSLLLVAGGTLLAVCKIVEPTMGLNLFLAVALRPLYIGLIIMVSLY